MERLRKLFQWLAGKPRPALAPVDQALLAFHQPDADTLELLRQLVAALRPRNRHDDSAKARYGTLLTSLERYPALLGAFRRHIVHFIASRRLVTFFTDSGILPGTGFFSEWGRIIGKRLLPEAPDERQLKDCLHVIYDQPDDWRWQAQIPDEYTRRFWALMAPAEELQSIDWRGIQEQMLDSVLLLAHRVSGLGIEGELRRASPNLDDDTPRFIALSAETQDFVRSFRAALNDPAQTPDDGNQLRVIADQCRDSLQRIRKRALTVGTSLHLSYLLMRSEQSLARLGELIDMLILVRTSATRSLAVEAWARFAHAAFLAENRRNSLPFYLSQLSRLLAVRVTENAARSGEHYICDTPADYSRMWRSAAGAGVLIGIMAMLKIKAAALHAPLFGEAFMFSMIYGLGFVLIYLLGLTVATKQPAMTAQTLAALLGDLNPRRQQDLERLVDVVAAVFRSQLAAIAGNVMVALPTAILIGYGLGHYAGTPPISLDKGARLLADLDLLSWAIPQAAIAGVFLCLSGLITGYFDNRAAYTDLGRRVGRLRWLRRLAGDERAGRVGDYLQAHLGGIMGNLLFGCMLGSTGIIGIILGLPLDIRHIAFSSANLGYALTAFDFALPLQAVLWAACGVAVIGLTNLTVSFALALRTALGARRIQFEHWGPVLRTLGRRFRREPRSFLLPPRQSADAGAGA